jgi:hypothetical protein
MQNSSKHNIPIILEEKGKHTAQGPLPAAPTKHPRSLELSSINGILRQHARQRLYVRPLHWTAEHLRLLGCVFISDRRAAIGKTRKETAVDEQLTRSVAEIAAYLKRGVRAELKAILMRDMLDDHGLYKAWYAGLSLCLESH